MAYDKTAPYVSFSRTETGAANIDFEDAVRTAVSYGGDSDTIAVIVGALAECVFGIPESIKRACLKYIPVTMVSTVAKFNKTYPKFA